MQMCSDNRDQTMFNKRFRCGATAHTHTVSAVETKVGKNKPEFPGVS